jgi:putative nucleotidyltransferase with HDIG domain
MEVKTISPDIIEQKVRKLAKLSTLPFMASSVMELVENPRTSAAQLGELISNDQVLAARILKVANSAYYGFPRKISTLNLAIVILGFNALRDLVLSISLIDRFMVKNEELIDLKQFWRHVLVVGRCSKILARILAYPVVGEVFVAGLLHDIGYLILIQEFPEEFKNTFEIARLHNLSFEEAELRELGFTHQQLGAWLGEGWNLPQKLVEVIRYHHDPSECPNQNNLVNFIHFTDLIAYTIGEGNGIKLKRKFQVEDVENKLKDFFPKNEYSLEYIQEKFLEETKKINELFAVI